MRSGSGGDGKGEAETLEEEVEEEGGLWLRVYLKASEQAADGVSRQRLARLAAALHASSSSSAWYTRCVRVFSQWMDFCVVCGVTVNV